METNKIIVFEDKFIRRVYHNEEWFFSIVDIIQVLTESPTPRQYWGKIKQREFLNFELSPIWVQLKMKSNFWSNTVAIQRRKRINKEKSKLA
jgi:hypothetical protein